MINTCSVIEPPFIPFIFQQPNFPREEMSLETFSKFPKDTELLRNRARTQNRRGEKLLGLLFGVDGHGQRGERAVGRAAAELEGDYEVRDSWHLRKYSTQVVNYTKKNF